MKVKEICEYGIKSKVKAGEGLTEGKYKFFTSSAEANKFVNEYQFDKPGIIMGTGGNATLHYCDTPFSVSTDCVVLFPKDKLITKYLYYFFRGNFHILKNGFKGVGLKHTSKKYINEIKIKKIPIQATQTQIIDVLDNIEDIITRKKQQLLEYDQLIKSRFVEMFGDINKNSKKFVQGLVKDYCEMTQGVQIPMSDQISSYKNGYYRYLYIQDLKYEKDDRIFVKDEHPGKILTEDDLVIVNTGNGSGEVFLGKDGILSNNLFKVTYDLNKFDQKYLYYYFSSDIFQRWLWGNMKKGTQPHLGHKIFGGKTLLIPSINLQKEFAVFVEQVDKLKFITLCLITHIAMCY